MVMGKKANEALKGGPSAATSETTKLAKVDGGTLVGRVLQSQGVKYLFAMHGGHTFPIMAALREHGVKLIH